MDEATLLHDQLLATKFFVPSSSHPLIPRPHLTTLLLQGLRRKLTLISAPAGFGKTTLLSAWVQSFPQESPESSLIAWVSLDESDNEPVLFWTYILTALDNQQPGLCTPLLMICMIIDLILLEGSSGVEVIHQVRKIFSNLPIILISEGCSWEIEAAMKALPSVRILRKPFKMATLLSTVKELAPGTH